MDVCDLYLEGKCLDNDCELRHTPNHPVSLPLIAFQQSNQIFRFQAVKKSPPTTVSLNLTDRHNLTKITEEREFDEGASTSKFMMESSDKLIDSTHANDSGIQHDDSKGASEINQN